jgi:hypothetical protein
MEQPDGSIVNGHEGNVRKLLKYLYGVKQAPKLWHEKFKRTLSAEGFFVNKVDKCVCYYFLIRRRHMIFGTNLNVIKNTKDF